MSSGLSISDYSRTNPGKTRFPSNLSVTTDITPAMMHKATVDHVL